jgi:phospholipase/carboxylesterase
MAVAQTGLLPCVELEPRGSRTAEFGVIWMHGLGANGHDFEPIVPQLTLSPELPVRFVFPHAPNRSVTINGGYVMPAWFDILTLERLDPVDETGILESVEQIHALITREIKRGIPANRIVLAGFSQGGVIALHAALRYPETLAGVIALSTYLPLHHQLTPEIIDANRSTPVFMAHGLYDSVLPFVLGKKSKEFLEAILLNIQWHEYPMDHGVSYEEIQDLGLWLNKILV